MEHVRLSILYLHLLACCVAIGLVIVSDVKLLCKLWFANHHRHFHKARLDRLSYTVAIALAILWITGATLVSIDILAKGWDYMDNPKIQVKIFLVCLLTLNGGFLHSRVLPTLKATRSLHNLSYTEQRYALIAGAISIVTWLYAAFIGIARAFSWKYSFLELIWPYPIAIILSYLAMKFSVSYTEKN